MKQAQVGEREHVLHLGSHGSIQALLGGGGGSLGESVLVGVVILAYMVYRQLTPRRLNTLTLVLVPVGMLYFLWRSFSSFNPTPSILTETAIDMVVALGIGLFAARQLRIYPSPSTGKAMVGGSLRYFLWWLLAFALEAGLAFAFGDVPTVATGPTVAIILPVFLLVVARNAYLYRRARSLGLALH